MGNAFTAVAQDEMVLFYNPAGLSSIHDLSPSSKADKSNNSDESAPPKEEEAPPEDQGDEEAPKQEEGASDPPPSEVDPNFYYRFELLSIQMSLNETIGTLTPPQQAIKWGQEPNFKFTPGINTDQSSDALFNDLVGRKIYAELDLSFLSLTTSNWGYTLFGNVRLDASIHNPVFPYIDLKTFFQYGIVTGFSIPVGESLDFGIGAKGVMRRGIVQELHLSDELLIAALNGETIQANDFISTAQAVALDMGLNYHHDLGVFAAVVQNIDTLDFGELGFLPMVMNIGFATEPEPGSTAILFAIDYLDVFNAHNRSHGDFHLQNLKVGLEFGCIPMWNGHYLFSVRTGRNGPYATSGFTLNPNAIGLFILPTIEYAQWSEELGSDVRPKPDRRQAFRLAWVF